jgi:biopolymer transport protein TolQ
MESGDLNILKIIWESGFVVKLVLLILIGLSVLSWTIIIQKMKAFKALEADDSKFDETFRSDMGLAEIYQVSGDYPESALCSMYKSGYEELQRISRKIGDSEMDLTIRDYFSKYGLEPLERALKKGATNSNEKMGTMLSTLATIGSVSPFVGLFGTVWGIINSFTGLSSGGGSIEAVAPGIAEALVATAVGLAAAIPAVWFFNYFNNKIEGINSHMDAFGEDYLNMIARSILIPKGKGSGV